MSRKFYQFILFAFFFFAFIPAFSQSCVNANLEMAGVAGTYPTGNGPSLSPQVFTFSNNVNNPTDNVMSAYSPATTVTFSLSNQQFNSMSTTPSQGMAFGRTFNTASALTSGMGGVGTVAATSYTSSNYATGAGLTAGTAVNATSNVGTWLMINDGNGQPGTIQRPYYGDLTITFSNPVDYPVLHFNDFGGITAGRQFTSEYEMISGYTMTKLSGSGTTTVISGDTIKSAPQSLEEASIRINGTGITTITFKVYMKTNATTAWPTTAANGEAIVIGVSIPSTVPNKPSFTKTVITNACPATTVNLNSVLPAAINGQSYEWHSVATGATAGTKIANPTSYSGASPVYLFAKDSLTGCYSASADTLAVNIVNCNYTISCSGTTVFREDFGSAMDNLPFGVSGADHPYDSTFCINGFITNNTAGYIGTGVNFTNDVAGDGDTGTHFLAHFSGVGGALCSTFPNQAAWKSTANINVVAGQVYEFSYYYRAQNNSGSATVIQQQIVPASGTITKLDSTYLPIQLNSWVKNTMRFTASVSGPVTLRLNDMLGPVGGNDFALDNIALTSVPLSMAALNDTIFSSCPAGTYNLSTLTPAAEPGYTYEWHTVSSNPSAATLIANPSAATGSGPFYLYTTGPFGCYSIPDTITAVQSNCPPTFGCTGNTIYFQNQPTDYYTVDLNTGVNTLIIDNLQGTTGSVGVNGIGYNATDGYIWGSFSASKVARVGADGTITSYTIAGLPAAFFNVGDVSNTGVLYLSSNPSGTIYRVDVNPASPTYLQLLTPNLTTSSYAIVDWAFNPIDGNLYTLSNTRQLVRINPTTGVATMLGGVNGGTPGINDDAAGFGAVFFDDAGTFYVKSNTTGRIYAVPNSSTLPASTSALITPTFKANGPAGTFNDGARCNTAPLCITPTNPVASVSALYNTCPATTVDLTSLQPAPIAGVTYEWHTVGTNPLTTTFVTNPNAVSTSGTYYLFAKSNAGSCYSNAADTVLVNVYNPCLDCDNDGVPNQIDIDDDNDGVLDSQEQGCGTTGAWTNLSAGVWQSSISTNLKVRVTFADVSGAGAWSVPGQALANFARNCNDYTSDYGQIVNVNKPALLFTKASNTSIGSFKVEYLDANNNPVLMPNARMHLGGIGGSGGVGVITSSSWKLQGGKTMTTLSQDIVDFGSTADSIYHPRLGNAGSGVNDCATGEGDATLAINGSNSTFTFNVKMNGPSIDQMIVMFEGCDQLDTDGDGIINVCDSEDDGDGCPTAYESGASTCKTCPTVAGPYGLNGLANSLENNDSPTASINYSSTYSTYALDSSANGNKCNLADCDGDGILNATDIDDDNDGILDVVENNGAIMYSGAEQSFVVPCNVTQLHVKLWGAGGGGSTLNNNSGGGGFASATIPVTPGETLTFIVGEGGKTRSIVRTFGGGGAGGKDTVDPGLLYGASGGGRTEIRRGSTTLVVAGGGGALGYVTWQPTAGNSNGGAGGGTLGLDATNNTQAPNGGGKGGTQSAGGAGGTAAASVGATYNGQSGSQFQGGDGGKTGITNSGGGGGGGGGWYGGGGGSGYGNDPSQESAGGGGSGYTSPTVSNGVLIAGTSGTNTSIGLAGNNTDPNYIAGIGVGAAANQNGGNGLIYIAELADFDNDGIANSCDLDSDGDGCPDAVEAGTKTVKTDSIFTGPVGANGLANSIENKDSLNASVINVPYYSISKYTSNALSCIVNACNDDCDNDGIPNISDIDDDNDGVLDVAECPSSQPYKVYMFSRNSTVPNVSTNIPISIVGKTTQNVFTDQVNAGADLNMYGYNWKLLASNVVSDATNKITVTMAPTATTTGTFILADAMLITNGTNTYVIDNSNPGFTQTGFPAQNIAGSYIGNENFSTSPHAGHTATWTFSNILNASACDKDNDGITNACDLDSDGDGCSDAYEGGATTSLAQTTFADPYGNNGLANSIESNDSINAKTTYTNTYTTFGLDNTLSKCKVDTSCSAPTNIVVNGDMNGTNLTGVMPGWTTNNATNNSLGGWIVNTAGANQYAYNDHDAARIDSLAQTIKICELPTNDLVVDFVYSLREGTNHTTFKVYWNGVPYYVDTTADAGAFVHYISYANGATGNIAAGSYSSSTSPIPWQVPGVGWGHVTLTIPVSQNAGQGLTGRLSFVHQVFGGPSDDVFVDSVVVKGANCINAGADTAACQLGTGNLTGKSYYQGTTTWSALGTNPGTSTIATPSAAVTTVSGFSAPGTYKYVLSNGTCSDTVNMTVTVCSTPDTVIKTPTCATCPINACVVADEIVGGATGSTFTTCPPPVGFTASTPDANGCVTYTPPSTPITAPVTTCIVACKNGLCDTTYVIINPTVTPDTNRITPTCPTCPINSCAVADDLTAGGQTYSSCGTPTGYTAVGPDANGCITYTPTGPNTTADTTCIIACKNGVCDTTYIIINPPVTPDTVIKDPACPTCPVNACVVADDLTATGQTFSSCGTPNGYTAVGPDANGCITYTPNGPNTTADTTCIIACKNGVCDTTYVIINPPVKPDTVIKTPTCPTCPVTVCQVINDVTITAGATFSSCPTPIGYTATPTDVNGCKTYTPTGPNTTPDTTCQVICKNGICDTTYIIINPPITPDTNTVTPSCPTCPVNTCVVADDLTSGGQTYSACPAPAGYTQTGPDANGCLTLTPTPGATGGTTCVVACKNGVCDTTYIIINPSVKPDTVTKTPACPTCPVTVCATADDLSGGVSGATFSSCTTPAGFTKVGPDANGCVTYTGPSTPMTVPVTTCVVACKNGICDTTYIIINPPVTPDTVTVTPTCPTCPVTICQVLDDIASANGATFSSCPVPAGYTVGPINANGCKTFTPTGPNTTPDTTCQVICKNGICDTTYIIINPPITPDTVTKTPACPTCPVNACVIADDLTGGVTGATFTTCPPPAGYTTSGPDANGCVTYTGPSTPGTAPVTTCIVACKNGKCDTTYIIINPPVTPDTVTKTPACPTCPVNACVVADDLTPGGQTYTSCGTPNGYTAVGPDVNGCITYTPNGPNTTADTTCIIACKNGKCDTTYVIINPPVKPDSITVQPTCPTCPVLACVTADDLPTGTAGASFSTCGLTPADATKGQLTLDLQGCLIWAGNGTQSPTDTIRTCVVACKNGVCDTTYVTVLPAVPPYGPDSIYVTPICSTCPTPSTCVTGDDIPSTGTNVTYSSCGLSPADASKGSLNFNSTTGCVVWTPNATQNDTVKTCVVKCADVTVSTVTVTICDTTYVFYPPSPKPDTIAVTPACPTCPVNACPTADDLTITSATTLSNCGTPSGYAASGPNAAGCMTYTPTSANTTPDTTCVVACNGAICDTTYVIINPPVTPDTVIKTPTCPTCPVNACVIADDLTATGQSFSSCGTPTGYTSVGPDANGCITYTPNGPNTTADTTCIVACKNGKCDTTYVIINPPITPDTVMITPSCATCPTNACVIADDISGGATGATFTTCPPPPGFTTSGPDANGCVTYTGPSVPNTTPVTTCIVACKNGVCDTTYVIINPPGENKLKPDFNTTYVNVPVNGNVSTNDVIVAPGSTYGTPTALPGNPSACVPVIASNGTYSFVCNTPGEHNFLVPVCPPGVTINCPTSLLTITVLDQNSTTNGPTADPDYGTTKQDNPITIDIKANDKCNNGPTCTLGTPTITDSASHGTVIVNPDGTVKYTPDPGFVGKDTLKYAVCDNQLPSKCDTEYVFIDVLPSNAPNSTTAMDDYNKGGMSEAVSGNVKTNDTDPEADNQSVTPQNTTIPGKGTFVLNPDGSYIFTPVDTFKGPIDIPYTTCDDGTPQACATATLHILIAQPDITPNITATPNIMHGTTTFNVTVKVTELNMVKTKGTITVRIPKDNRLAFTYNPAAVKIGFTNVSNSVWTYNGTNPFFHVFTTTTVIPKGGFSTFGFVASFAPGNTDGKYTMTSTISSGSGSENRTNNNTDSESLDYFHN